MKVDDVVAEIESRIRSGRWPTGYKLPLTGQLTAEFGICATTLDLTMRILRERGLVRTQQGLGRYVSDVWASRERL